MTTQEANESGVCGAQLPWHWVAEAANAYWQHEMRRVDTCMPEPSTLVDSDWSVGWE